MDTLQSAIIATHLLLGLAIIVLVLLQQGKGAELGASFGSGASGSLFGATGSANFLSRTTAVLAALFFATSLGLAYIATHKPKTDLGIMSGATSSSPSPVDPATPPPSENNKPLSDDSSKSDLIKKIEAIPASGSSPSKEPSIPSSPTKKAEPEGRVGQIPR